MTLGAAAVVEHRDGHPGTVLRHVSNAAVANSMAALTEELRSGSQESSVQLPRREQGQGSLPDQPVCAFMYLLMTGIVT